MHLIEEKELKIDQESICSRLPSRIAETIQLDSYLDWVREASQLKGLYRRVFPEKTGTDTVEMEGITFTSRVLSRNLQDAHQVFPYVITCGYQLDEEASSHNMGVRYYLDLIANQYVSLAQEKLMSLINQRYSLVKSARLSPGSLEDWPIEEQKLLFQLMGEEKVEKQIGVSLTESYLMVPTKTVSGIIFPTEVDFSSCQLCPRENCSHRKMPYDQNLAREYFYAG